MIVFSLCAWLFSFALRQVFMFIKVTLISLSAILFVLFIPAMLVEFFCVDLWILLICTTIFALYWSIHCLSRAGY